MSESMNDYITLLKSGKILSERQIRTVCETVKEVLVEENNVQPVSAPVTVCGDTHGQFYDLLKIFTVGGELPTTNYIFMGDYVDRGYHSVETFSLLLCLKVLYPGKITLLRGNHETRQISRCYGLYDEVIRKYGNTNVWTYFTEVFDYLNIAALIEGKIMCCHGGLSPECKTIDQIRLINRFGEVPASGAFTDIMWSDPEDIDSWAINPRQAGWLFGAKVTNEFCTINGLELICRAHQLVMDGYKIWFEKQNLTTVWSCPNYCYRCGNQASILQIDDQLEQNYLMFDEAQVSSKFENYKKVVPYFL